MELHLSLSGLRRAACPRFFVKDYRGDPPERMMLHLLEGRKIHEAIASYLKTKDERALDDLTVGLKENVLKVLPGLIAGAEKIEVERKIEVKIEGVKFLFVPDLIIYNGDVLLVDHKTQGWGQQINELERQQLELYAALLLKTVRKGSVSTAVFRVRSGQLLEGPRVERKKAREFLKKFAPQLKREAERIKGFFEGEAPAEPGRVCSICPYVLSCEYRVRDPENPAQLAKLYVLLAEKLKTIRESLRGETIRLEGGLNVGMKKYETLVCKKRGLEALVAAIARRRNKIEREMLIEELASFLKLDIRKAKTRKFEAFLQKLKIAPEMILERSEGERFEIWTEAEEEELW